MNKKAYQTPTVNYECYEELVNVLLASVGQGGDSGVDVGSQWGWNGEGGLGL